MTVFKSLKSTYRFKSTPWKHDKVLSRPLLKTELINKVQDYWHSVEHHAWPDAPYYTGTGLHYNKRCELKPVTKQLCGNHGNRLDYQDTLAYDQLIPQDLLGDLGDFPLVRCKIGCLDGRELTNHNVNSWHRDETPFEVLRVIVPITSSESYRFQMENQPDICLEPGNIYAFDQSTYHRVFTTVSSPTPRIHLILSFVTWFDTADGIWIPNDHCGRRHPLALFDAVNL